MKKMFLTLAVALGVFASASAQEAGQMWVGGTAGVWSSKVKGEDSELSFKVMPEFGYNFADNLAVGIVIGAAHTHGGKDLKFDNETANKAGALNLYSVSPFLRYSVIKGDLGALFVDGGVGYEWGKYCGVDSKLNNLEVGFRPGVSLNVSSKVALVSKFGFLGYQNQKTTLGKGENKVKTTSDNFGLDLDLRNIQLGAVVKF